MEREGLKPVIDNARKSAEAGYPDFTADDPATFHAVFITDREREGMIISQALGLGLGGASSGRRCPSPGSRV